MYINIFFVKNKLSQKQKFEQLTKIFNNRKDL